MDVGVEHGLQVRLAGDEDPVGAFAVDGGDNALGDGVHSWRLWGSEYHVDAERGGYGVEGWE
jgi:hypothetical protein